MRWLCAPSSNLLVFSAMMTISRSPAGETKKTLATLTLAQTGNGVLSTGILSYVGRTPRREAALGGARWPRIAGFRVVASWPEGGYARPPRSIGPWARMAGVLGVLLILAGAGTVGVVFRSQQHAPQPSAG